MMGPAIMMGEERDEHGIRKQSLTSRDALAKVDQVGDLGEGEKRNAEGQNHIRKGVSERPVRVKEVEKREEVLVINEQQNIRHDGQHQDAGLAVLRTRCTVAGFTEAAREEKVHQHAGAQQQQVRGVPVAVEKK